MGPRAGRMHVRAARCADRRRQRAHLPHGHAADLPPHGPFRDLHDAAWREGTLFQRLASASIARGCAHGPQHLHARSRRRMPVAGGAQLSRRASRPRRALDRVRHAHRQRVSPLQAELAGAGPRLVGLRSSRRDGARAGRAGRSRDADGKPHRRARRQSLSLHSVADRLRPCGHGREERSRRAG